MLRLHYGCEDVLEVVNPPPPDPKTSLSSRLEQNLLRLKGQPQIHFRCLCQRLMALDPQDRCSPKEALEQHFFISELNADKAEEMQQATLQGSPSSLGMGLQLSHTSPSSLGMG